MARSTNRLDREIEKIADDELRRRIAEEVRRLRATRSFGLVFDNHLPEEIRLPRQPIRRFCKVGLRDRSTKQTWVVVGFAGADRSEAILRDRDGAKSNRPVSELVVVRECGEIVFPGLEPAGWLSNGEPDDAHHIVINGENYHVLEALAATHHESVDLIYIDPPYNTGGKTSWLYNDKFVDKSDHAKSSKWLSFMERRLRLAHDLLKPTGVIFVSIGDDEQHRLRMLMDQVFKPENCVATLAVEMSTTSGPKTTNAQQGTIVKNIEYVQVYRKSAQFDRIAHTPLYDGVDSYDTHYSLWLNEDGTIGSLADEMLRNDAVASDIKQFGLTSRRGSFSIANLDQLLAVSQASRDFLATNLTRIARVDRPPVSAAEADATVGRYIEVPGPDRTYLMTRLANGTLQQVVPLSLNYRMSDDYKPRYGRTVIRGDLWRGFHQDMGNVGKEGAVPFNNGKKPIRLIKQLIRWANNSPDAVILDFFGGSGTTTHAVIAMNADDGGRRQSILVTNNEVSVTEAKRLRKSGYRPGDPEWEAEGVFERVTRPRITNVVGGSDPARPGEFAANVAFFNLQYLDKGRVRGRQEFAAIAPLLWMQAGGVGALIDKPSPRGFSVTDRYGVLFDLDRAEQFIHEIESRPSQGMNLERFFIVTDSVQAFQDVRRLLPMGGPSHKCVQLYEDYLSNFEINGDQT